MGYDYDWTFTYKALRDMRKILDICKDSKNIHKAERIFIREIEKVKNEYPEKKEELRLLLMGLGSIQK